MIQIYDTDTVKECADKIFNHFEVGQSCSIYGVEVIETPDRWKPFAKGELVWKELEVLDFAENTVRRKGKKNARKRKLLPNSIGGYVAHKIFQHKHYGGDNPKYVIWRVQ